MAKPIFHVTVSSKMLPHENAKGIRGALKELLNDEYHVLISILDGAEYKAECFNDCNGLPDVDIEKLIKDYTNGIHS